jgi:hypothetical protein
VEISTPFTFDQSASRRKEAYQRTRSILRSPLGLGYRGLKGLVVPQYGTAKRVVTRLDDPVAILALREKLANGRADESIDIDAMLGRVAPQQLL